MKEDSFSTLARYYDVIMAHVDYARWASVSDHLADALPGSLRYLDVGCGTGTMLEYMADTGRSCFGLDLSPSMANLAYKTCPQAHVAVGTMAQLPFAPSFHLITCLFDSLNFVLEEDAVQSTIQGFRASLLPGGLLYFDVVTERMVTEHFLGPEWSEQHGPFTSNWRTKYDRETKIAETTVRVNSGEADILRERIYPIEWLEKLLKDAGLDVLACYDANTWKKPGRRTVRVEFIAGLEVSPAISQKVSSILMQMRNS